MELLFETITINKHFKIVIPEKYTTLWFPNLAMLFCWILKGGEVEEDHRKPAPLKHLT